MLEPAKTVIETCGGFARTAELAGRSEIRVRRWAYPKDRGGTGGVVPAEVAQDLLRNAREVGIDLRPEHFFAPDCVPTEDLPYPEVTP